MDGQEECVDEIVLHERLRQRATAENDVGVARPQQYLRLGADRSCVAVIENQLNSPAHDIQELVSVGMDLAAMGWNTIEMRDRPDRVAIDPSRRIRRSGHDGD
jgi:hypothetical protein